ncbi:MAG: tetratricopeptide repeat protein [Burkholderiales bacterium]
MVFLLGLSWTHVQPTGFRPWASSGWAPDKPAAEVAGLNGEGNARGEEELERAVRAQPDDWALHVELIEVSAAANRLPERTRWYQAWLAEDRDDAPANPKRQAMLHAALGTVHWRGGDLRSARLEYRQAVRLDPGNPAYTEALETLDAQLGWQPRDTLLLLLFFLIIVAYVALRRRRWSKALRG